MFLDRCVPLSPDVGRRWLLYFANGRARISVAWACRLPPGGRPVRRWWQLPSSAWIYLQPRVEGRNRWRPNYGIAWRSSSSTSMALATASEDDGRWHHGLVLRARLARESGGFWAVGAHQAPGGVRDGGCSLA